VDRQINYDSACFVLQNILITKDEPYTVKIADFGSAKSLKAHSGLKSKCGTCDYMAPEVEIADGIHSTYDLKADCYSLGVTVFFMLSGRCPDRPAPGVDMEKIGEIQGENLKILSEKAVSDKGIEFVTKLMAYRSEDRLSVSEALEHEWLRVLPGTLPMPPLSQKASDDTIRPISPVEPSGEMDGIQLASEAPDEINTMDVDIADHVQTRFIPLTPTPCYTPKPIEKQANMVWMGLPSPTTPTQQINFITPRLPKREFGLHPDKTMGQLSNPMCDGRTKPSLELDTTPVTTASKRRRISLSTTPGSSSQV